MVPSICQIFITCFTLLLSTECHAYMSAYHRSNQIVPGGCLRSLSTPISRPNFLVTFPEQRKLFSSVMKPADPAPIKPGPLKFIKRMVMTTVLVLKINSLKVLSGFIGAISAIQNKVSGGDQKDKTNANKNKAANKIMTNLVAMMKKKSFWLQLALGLMMGVFLRYLAFTKSLTTELSYTSFLQLISIAPERVAALRVTPGAFMFRLDGKLALTRMVNLEPNVMKKLIASGIDFAALPAPTNVLGLVWTFAYAAFIWNVSSKMMQGPQDEGAGKRKDKAGELDAYGKLSFEDVAGQERAKLEVKEVCEMLQAPEKYLTVGARLPSGVLLVGPPGTGENPTQLN